MLGDSGSWTSATERSQEVFTDTTVTSLEILLKQFINTSSGQYYQHQAQESNVEWAAISYQLSSDPEFIEFFNTKIQPLHEYYSMDHILLCLRDILNETGPKHSSSVEEPGGDPHPCLLNCRFFEGNDCELKYQSNNYKSFEEQEDHNGTMSVDDIPVETFSLQHMFEFEPSHNLDHGEPPSASNCCGTELDADQTLPLRNGAENCQSSTTDFPCSASPIASQTDARLWDQRYKPKIMVTGTFSGTLGTPSVEKAYTDSSGPAAASPESLGGGFHGAPIESPILSVEHIEPHENLPQLFSQVSPSHHYAGLPVPSVGDNLENSLASSTQKVLMSTTDSVGSIISQDCTQGIGCYPRDGLSDETFDWVVDQLTVSSRYGAGKRIPSDHSISFKLQAYMRKINYYISQERLKYSGLEADKRIDDPVAWVHVEVAKLMPQWKDVIASTEIMGEHGPGMGSISHEISAYTYFSQFIGGAPSHLH